MLHRIGSDCAMSPGTFRQHFKSLQIVIHGFCRALAN
jgi:hypothetical protein